MTHQHGGRPGSGTYSGGKYASGGGVNDRGSRNWEIAHGIDLSGKTSQGQGGDGDVRSSHNKSNKKLIHAAGDEFGYDLLGRMKGRTSKQLREIIKEIYLMVHLGARCGIEDILDRPV